MSRWDWGLLTAVVRFSVQGGQGERFFNQCAQQELQLQKIHATPLGFEAEIPAREYGRLHRIARKNRCRLRVRSRRGLAFLLAAYRGRWGIAVGAALCLALMLMGPNLIWNIEFYEFTPAQEVSVRAQLYEAGIYEGAWAKPEYLASVADSIFVSSQEYGWISLNFVKGRLMVEKNDRTPPPEIIKTDITDLVAKCSGTIVKTDIRGGFLEKSVGQSVAEGEVLASGCRFDEKLQKSVYTHSEGEIYAEVEKTYCVTQPLTVRAQMPGGVTRTVSRLLLPTGVLPLGPQGLEEGQTVTDRQPVTLLGFNLPATVETVRLRPMQTVEQTLTPTLAADRARMAAYAAIAQEFGACQILSREETLEEEEEAVTLSLRVVMIVNIAKQQPFSGLM